MPTVKVTLAVWLSPPLVPVIVNGKLPEGVELVVEIVRVDPDPFTEDGVKLAVAPLGSPLAVNATWPLNPFNGDSETVKVVLPPGGTDSAAGAAESEKFGVEELTLKLTVPVWLTLPLVAVIVRVKLPAGVEVVVEIFKVDDPDPVTEDGLKLAVAPLGKPLTLNETVLLNPFSAAAEMV